MERANDFDCNNVVSIESKSDAVLINLDNGEKHIIPVSAFRHVASGKITVNKIADFIPIYKEITRQWLVLSGY